MATPASNAPEVCGASEMPYPPEHRGTADAEEASCLALIPLAESQHHEDVGVLERLGGNDRIVDPVAPQAAVDQRQ